jgi:hypothetical protein
VNCIELERKRLERKHRVNMGRLAAAVQILTDLDIADLIEKATRIWMFGNAFQESLEHPDWNGKRDYLATDDPKELTIHLFFPMTDKHDVLQAALAAWDEWEVGERAVETGYGNHPDYLVTEFKPKGESHEIPHLRLCFYHEAKEGDKIGDRCIVREVEHHFTKLGVACDI